MRPTGLPIEPLSFDRWHVLKETFEQEFRNAMPETPAQATFLAALNGEELAGFVHVESLLNLNCIYVTAKYRHTMLPLELAQNVDRRLSEMKGFSAIAMPDQESHIRLYHRFGGRQLYTPLGVWRKDY